METTWSAYKAKPANMALYSPDATLTFIPTGVTVQTNADIRKFYLSKKSTSMVETVYNQVIGQSKIVEEVEWVVTFNEGECHWLLPNLEQHYFVHSTIKIPVVISSQFENELITGIRFYWDQASVLKQLRVISDRNKWPVIGVEQSNALRSPSSSSNPTSPTPSTELPAKFNPGYNAFVPGRIFGPVHPDDQVRHPIRKPADAPSRNIFAYAPPEKKPLVAHQPNRLGSSFTLAHDEGLRPTTSTTTNASDDDGLASPTTPPTNNSGRAIPESRNIFAQYDENLVKKTSQLKVSEDQSSTSKSARNILAHH